MHHFMRIGFIFPYWYLSIMEPLTVTHDFSKIPDRIFSFYYSQMGRLDNINEDLLCHQILLSDHDQKLGFPGGTNGKESTCQFKRPKRHSFNPWVRKIPWSRKWQPIPLFLAWKVSWTEEPGKLQSMGLQTIRHDWSCTHTLWPKINIHFWMVDQIT